MTSSLEGRKMEAIIPTLLKQSINIAGMGLSSSAITGAAIVTNLPTKLQIPVEVILL